MPNWSTWTEWSITRSTGTSGLMRAGSPPISAIASRMAARSTTHGTPVKSWRITRAGMNGSSNSAGWVGSQAASARTSSRSPGPSRVAACAQQVLEEHLDGVRQARQVARRRRRRADGRRGYGRRRAAWRARRRDRVVGGRHGMRLLRRPRARCAASARSAPDGCARPGSRKWLQYTPPPSRSTMWRPYLAVTADTRRTTSTADREVLR